MGMVFVFSLASALGGAAGAWFFSDTAGRLRRRGEGNRAALGLILAFACAGLAAGAARLALSIAAFY